jgi:hypothetical protein
MWLKRNTRTMTDIGTDERKTARLKGPRQGCERYFGLAQPARGQHGGSAGSAGVDFTRYRRRAVAMLQIMVDLKRTPAAVQNARGPK